MANPLPLVALLVLMLSQCTQQSSAPVVPPPRTSHVKSVVQPAPRHSVHKMKNGEGSLYMPASLCYVDEIVPGIKTDLKYCGNDNFTGRPVAGYTSGRRAILRRDTAECIKRAQQELAGKGLGLLVWDAYRPHRAMDDFYAWSKTPDGPEKSAVYPNISKQGIYEGKYIRRRSEHSWGVAVDVTIIDLNTGQELDMGGRHDLLDISSATRYTGITPEQHRNRMLLRDTMDRAGMRNYKREWWHYFLKERGNVTRYDFPLCDTLIPLP